MQGICTYRSDDGCDVFWLCGAIVAAIKTACDKRAKASSQRNKIAGV